MIGKETFYINAVLNSSGRKLYQAKQPSFSYMNMTFHSLNLNGFPSPVAQLSTGRDLDEGINTSLR